MTTPQWAFEKIQEAKDKNLTLLDLSRELSQSSDSLSNIPEDVFQLPQLTTLFLSGNKIVSIPDAISRLQNLTMLFMNNNRLTDLSENVAKLQNLTTLDLAGNQLAILPEAIAKLQNLTTLYLEFNQLSSLPDELTKLRNLRSLILNHNRLTELPSSITNLQSLVKLDLSSNHLVDLPESITNLRGLVELNLADNQLETPPQEVAVKGVDAVREYYRQLKEAGQDHLYEAKLLILGEGGAGKTTLAKKIGNSNYQLQDEISTQGIDVSQWSFPIDGGKSFRVNLWDFGGQEIYHATHQFFLTKRSLYALVVDVRKEDTDFYYWLNVVELLSDSSPLLVIKNEKQDRHREIDERQLRGQFSGIKEFLACNFSSNRGLDEIKSEIKHYVKSLPHIGSPLPKTWVKVRDALERDKRNYISFDNYLEICKNNGFDRLKDSLLLSGYLHDLGVCLHFQDDPLLRRIVILKPHWGTDAVYKVLDNPTVIRNLGRFNRSNLSAIWNASEYTGMHDELIQLMMKFKLCYQIPNTKDEYIAPQLLTVNQPQHPWNDQENLLLRYTYEFMPKGILTQFIVSMNSSIVTVNRTSLVWRSGVVVAKNQTGAEIIEYYGKREIRVKVAGVHKKELMTIVMYELDKIHATYKRLKYDKLIPCNCAECKKRKEPYFYRYETLQKFIEDRQDQIQCQYSYKMVNVYSLVDDVIEKEHTRDGHDGSPVQQYYINHVDRFDGGAKMNENKISINNSTVYGGVVAAESIKDSFNTIEKADIKDDLKEQLKQLNQAVEAMVKELPKEQAEEVAEDMQKLTEEAVKEKPKEKWYSVSIDGLVAAAQNVGKVGDAVIDAAGNVRKILTGGLL